MSELVKRASDYATRAHQRIDQRRKYSKQPYHVHLEAVAKTVAGVTDDQEAIAAAWLHDTVNDESIGTGIFTENGRGDVQLLVRKGSRIDVSDDPMTTDVRTVNRVYFIRNSMGIRGFNRRGQVAFLGSFTDGSSGIFVSDPVAVPEPSARLPFVALKCSDGSSTLKLGSLT